MYIVEVIPMKRGIQVETLTYFSSVSYERGTILTIPLRKSMTEAIVIDVTEASRAKTALRAATFSLRKLPRQTQKSTLSPALLSTADTLAEYYAATTGAVLFSLLPAEIRSGKITIPPSTSDISMQPLRPEVLEATREERYRIYRSFVRAALANKQSVQLIVPSIEDAVYAETYLGKGIEQKIVTLHSGFGIKKIGISFELLSRDEEPKLIITTPQYAFIDRENVGLMLIERCRAHGYRSRQRPYLDFRHALTLHAKFLGRRIMLGDLLPQTEDEWMRREGKYETYDEHPKRIALPGTLHTILMHDKPDGVTAFKLFSDELLLGIEEMVKKKERAFLLAPRRGLAPVVACVDCGHILRSSESGAPLSLHRVMKDGVEERWLVCSVSGYRVRAYDTCPSCGSWRLRERGIGIQQVYDELIKILPERPTILFDHTTAKTHRRATQLCDEFYVTKGSIMVGTTLALSYLTHPVFLSAVVSMDALRAIPSWRQQEESLFIILTLRERTKEHVLVQTRISDDDILDYAAKGSVERFYDDEINLRETFHYPPFFVFIHLTWLGAAEAVEEMKTRIETEFKAYDPNVYGMPASEPGKQIKQCLIRVPTAEWPNAELLQILYALPPSVRIMINPDRIV